MKIVDAFKLRKVVDEEIGIEIEMEGRNLLRGNSGAWNYHEDNSLRGESAEYVLRNPVSRSRVQEVLQQLQKALHKAGSELNPSDRCGVHIHMNCQKLTVKQVFCFAILYLIFEDLLVRWCGSDREGNLFCMRSKDAEGLITALATAASKNSLLDLQYDSYRYASINLFALSKYGSVEFRSMRTTKEFEPIATWAELLIKVKDGSLKFNHPKEIIETLSLQGPVKFAENIFGDMYRELAHKDNEIIIIDAVRRVQRVAYNYDDTVNVEQPSKLKKTPIVDDFETIVPDAVPHPVWGRLTEPARPGVSAARLRDVAQQVWGVGLEAGEAPRRAGFVVADHPLDRENRELFIAAVNSLGGTDKRRLESAYQDGDEGLARIRRYSIIRGTIPAQRRTVFTESILNGRGMMFDATFSIRTTALGVIGYPIDDMEGNN